MIQYTFAKVGFTYHAINFIIYTLSNKRFADEVKSVFRLSRSQGKRSGVTATSAHLKYIQR